MGRFSFEYMDIACYRIASGTDTIRHIIGYNGVMSSKNEPTIIEATVLSRDKNVLVHKEITKATTSTIDNFLHFINAEQNRVDDKERMRLSTKIYTKNDVIQSYYGEAQKSRRNERTLLLLHGWMGDKDEWDDIALSLVQDLPSDWSIVSIDLPGHGESESLLSESYQLAQTALGLVDEISEKSLTVRNIAKIILETLYEDYGLNSHNRHRRIQRRRYLLLQER